MWRIILDTATVMLAIAAVLFGLSNSPSKRIRRRSDSNELADAHDEFNSQVHHAQQTSHYPRL